MEEQPVMRVSIVSFVTDSDSEWLNMLFQTPWGLHLSQSCNNSKTKTKVKAINKENRRI